MVSPFQIRAARAALDWSQAELAERAGISISALIDCEREKRPTSEETYKKLIRAFEQEAVFITGAGVERRDSATYVIDGEEWWLDVLDDVYYELADRKKPEMLMMFSDDRLSPPAVNDRIRAMRKAGIAMRQLVREDNRHLMGAPAEYRWVPAQYFRNNVTVIYGPKIAICAEDNTKAVIFRDRALADSWRNVFEMLWHGVVLKTPDESTADEKY
jgi:transcriptional regulator with XRE-family HTH domain